MLKKSIGSLIESNRELVEDLEKYVHTLTELSVDIEKEVLEEKLRDENCTLREQKIEMREQNKGMFDDLNLAVKEYVKMMEEIESKNKSLWSINNENVSDGTVQENLQDKYEKKWKAEMKKKKINESYYHKNDKYLRFFKDYWVVNHANLPLPWADDNEDIVELVRPETEADYRCPLTLNWFQEPMKTPCGHTFSKEAILNHLRSSHECPQSGCLIKNLTRNQLIADTDLERKMHEFRAKMHLTQRSTQDVLEI